MLFIETVSVAIVAYIFADHLTGPGMIFEPWYQWLERLSSDGKEWMAKPLGYCGFCFSGQVGFWWYLIAYRDRWILGEHIVFACQTMFFYLIIKLIYQKNAN
jgi:hypothetical protein